MIFDKFNGVENYNTTLYLHKSKIVYDEEGNKYSAKLVIDLEQNSKKDKLVKQIFNKESGTSVSCRQKTKRTNRKALNFVLILSFLVGFT